jgi:transglutaminase-like putative cysteine protease
MYLERLLQINMATLAALGALLLGMGQRSEAPPLLVALAAAASVWLTDLTGWLRIGRRMANLLVLLAATVSIGQVLPLRSELQAFDLAWFMIYLQVILLFQKKDERLYWLLIVLSLLEVIVATLFSQGAWFGILLALYLLLGFSAMTLLLLYRQWDRYQPVADALHSSSLPVPAERGSALRWPLAGQQADFAAMPGGHGQAALCRELFSRLGRMGLQSLALALLLFFTVPRFGQFAWRGAIGQPRALVGFSDKVVLGALGQIIESRDEVMRVWFYRYPGQPPQRVGREIYLQGAFLMNYRHGQWEAGETTVELGNSYLQPEERPLPPLVRQKIVIEALDHNELFCVAPYIPLEASAYISVDHARQRLLRADHFCNRQFDYSLGTTAIVNGAQLPLTPSWQTDSIRGALVMPPSAGPDSLPNLVALARRWIAESGLPRQNRLGRARCLERKLAASGLYQYSLAGQDRDPNLDPIEDFLTKHPQGHCEYFATALTLMLRSQGIPARMVVGYKCDEWNSVGGYYQVRQLHAHTWVEAYLRYSQIPDNLKHGGNYWPWSQEGGWLRLDPTPGAAHDKAAGWLTPFRQGLDWLDFAWSNYVVELDCKRQRDAIYQPISRMLRKAWQEATDLGRWRARFHAVAAALHLDQLRGIPGWLTAAVALLALAAILASTAWLLWRVAVWLRTHGTGNHIGRTRHRRSQIEFYCRFERLLSRQGIVRAAGQTQHEFAVSAGLRLARQSGDSRWTALPEVVAEAFYRIRFGRQPLDNTEAEAVEHALTELAACSRPQAVGRQTRNSP